MTDRRTGTGTGSTQSTQFEIPGLAPARHAGGIGRLDGYELQALLGHGAMGIVYRAWESDLSRSVAIKFLAPKYSFDAAARERFLREGRTAAAVKHPHIVTIHKVGEHAGIPYLVMEHVEGESLHELLHRERPLSVGRVLDLARQIGEGLAAAHEAGIIHRDIKPSNILIERSTRQVKIVDFGLARPLATVEELTMHGQMLGTPSFMSPEQARGQAVDARSDLFSLGCVYYALIAGHSPFQGSTAIESVRRVIDHSPPPLPITPLPVPEAFLDLVNRLLSKSPMDRYASAREVLRALESMDVPHIGYDATVVAPRSPQDVPRKFAAPPWLIGAVLLVAVAGAVWWQANREPEGLSTPLVTPRTAHDPPKQPGEIRVSRTGSADYRDLEVAVQQAGPGDHIRVTDGGDYRVHLLLADAERLRGVTIESTGPRRATLSSRLDESPVLEFVGVSDVTVRGFRIESPPQAHAVLLRDGTAGVTLEDLTIQQAAEGRKALIHVAGSQNSAGLTPNRIRRCEIHATGEGQALWLHGDPQPTGPLVIEHNRLSAAQTLVGVWGRHHDVQLRHNVFLGGMNAVNLVLHAGPSADELTQLTLQNNTFFRSGFWLGLISSVPPDVQVDLRNNLMVDCHGMEASETALTQAAQNWTVANNLWRPATGVQRPWPEIWHRWATVTAELPLLSEQSDSSDFLVPPVDSACAKQGANGNLPIYIGALQPR